jgi:sporulation integral membrane protein YlbJ
MKKYHKTLITDLPKIFCAIGILLIIIIQPETATKGIKNGITLLLTIIIPSLFPFLVLASFISSSKSFYTLSGIFKPLTTKIFKINKNGFIPILMGLTGGYPIGAKVTADLYKSNRLTQNEAERLMLFTVNSGPAFALTAVGTNMLGNSLLGIILYISTILTSLTIGFFCRFLSDKRELEQNNNVAPEKTESAFINSVASGANAIINISAWVLTFSCLSEIIFSFNLGEKPALFLNAIMEVSNGCKVCSPIVSLPLISAILGFGSFSVICQVSPYLKVCNVKMKHFLVSRILNASLSAFFTFNLLKIFPEAVNTGVVFHVASKSLNLSYTVGSSIILLVMCLIFILQVDNHKKVC